MDSRFTLTSSDLTPNEQREVHDILTDLTEHPAYAESASLVLEYAGRILSLPRPFLFLIQTIMKRVDSRDHVGIVSSQRQLSLTETAYILDISIEEVDTFLSNGHIRHRGTGDERTVSLIDLLTHHASETKTAHS